MSHSLEDQVVLVVGASSGIGQATALAAARAGARVVAAARRGERLLALQASLGTAAGSLLVHVADAGSVDDMQALVARTLQAHGRIDTAVYAAGTNTVDRAMQVMPPATWNDVLTTNLTGAFYLSHAVLPSMRAAGGGHLIYVSSTAGAIADMSGAAYQASKRGLLGLAHAIRLEERARGIRTCCIMPGLTNTELVEKRPEKLPAETLRLALQPDDVAATILHVMQLPPHVTMPEILMMPALV